MTSLLSDLSKNNNKLCLYAKIDSLRVAKKVMLILNNHLPCLIKGLAPELNPITTGIFEGF